MYWLFICSPINRFFILFHFIVSVKRKKNTKRIMSTNFALAFNRKSIQQKTRWIAESILLNEYLPWRDFHFVQPFSMCFLCVSALLFSILFSNFCFDFLFIYTITSMPYELNHQIHTQIAACLQLQNFFFVYQALFAIAELFFILITFCTV